MSLRIIIAVGFLAFLNAYATLRLVARLPWAQQHLGFVIIIALSFFALQLAAPFLDHQLFPELRRKYAIDTLISVIDWVSYAALGVLSCLVMYLLIADIVTTIWALIALPDDLAQFQYRTALIVGAFTLGTVALGIIQAAAGPVIVQQEVRLAHLPKRFDGFRIAQISDLHISSTIKRDYVEKVVAKANALNPDLIVLTGDMVDGTVNDLRDDVAPLATLRSAHGTYFVTGNHEYYWHAPSWVAEFARIGMHTLVNQHAVITRDTDSIVLAGITDYSAGAMVPAHTPNAHKALEGAPSDRVKILLAHQPASYKMAHEAGFDLQLSGHTHAGQFFPFSMFIGLFQRYYKGLNQHDSLQIYVNKGTGYWGPPLRTGVPPEITLLTLRAK